MGRSPSRPRRNRLHRRPGLLGHRPGDDPRGGRPRTQERILHPGDGRRARAPGGQRQPVPGHGGGRSGGRGRRRRQPERAPSLPGLRARRGLRAGRGGGPPGLPLPRPAPGPDAARHAAARQGQPGRAACPGRRRLRRGRDPDPDPLHAGGRARLPRPRPAQPRLVVRAAAVAPAVQAAAHGGGDGALLSDRPLLSRRGLPRRPPARVHPARRRDVLRRPGRRHRRRRGRSARGVGARRLRAGNPDPAHDVRRRDGTLRVRQARSALRMRTGQPRRVFQGHAVQGVPERIRGGGGHARRGLAAAPNLRQVAGMGEGPRRERPRLRDVRRRRHSGRPGREEHLRVRARRAGRKGRG